MIAHGLHVGIQRGLRFSVGFGGKGTVVVHQRHLAINDNVLLIRQFDHEVGLPVVALPVLETSRSEEHTSELQSLMRISYAVFCLQKKKHVNLNHYNKRILI